MVDAGVITSKGAGTDHRSAYYVVTSQGILRRLIEADKNSGLGRISECRSLNAEVRLPSYALLISLPQKLVDVQHVLPHSNFRIQPSAFPSTSCPLQQRNLPAVISRVLHRPIQHESHIVLFAGNAVI